MGSLSLHQRAAAYLQLLRVSNVLTPVADIWMGAAVGTGRLAPSWPLAAVTIASVCLYLSGMVLNDVFDTAVDAAERPERPIPSGRVSRWSAMRLGFGLSTAGMVLAGAASLLLGSGAPLAVALVLNAAIFCYNAGGKHPLLMAACRGLNVALGFSVAISGGSSAEQVLDTAVVAGLIGAAMAAYILGVTLFAKREAGESTRGPLMGAALVAAGGITMLATSPWSAAGRLMLGSGITPVAWITLWLVVTLLIFRRPAAAILQPTPRHVQSAVGGMIAGVILLDAALAWGYAGRTPALAIFSLYPLTLLLARFVRPT